MANAGGGQTAEVRSAPATAVSPHLLLAALDRLDHELHKLLGAALQHGCHIELLVAGESSHDSRVKIDVSRAVAATSAIISFHKGSSQLKALLAPAPLGRHTSGA